MLVFKASGTNLNKTTYQETCLINLYKKYFFVLSFLKILLEMYLKRFSVLSYTVEYRISFYMSPEIVILERHMSKLDLKLKHNLRKRYQ